MPICIAANSVDGGFMKPAGAEEPRLPFYFLRFQFFTKEEVRFLFTAFPLLFSYIKKGGV